MPRATTRMIPLLAMVALSVCLAEQAQAQVELRWKFTAGESLRLETLQTVKTVGSVGEEVFSNKIHSEAQSLVQVRGVTDSDQADLEVGLQRFKLQVDSPFGSAKIDTAGEEADEAGGLGDILELYRELSEVTYRVEVGPRGEVGQPQFNEADLARVRENTPIDPVQLEMMVSPEALSDFGRVAWMSLPEGPVEPGAEWTEERTMLSQNGATMPSTVHYRYEGPEPRDDGRTLQKISLTVDVDMKNALANVPEGSQVEVKTEEMTGTAYFDAAAGRLVEQKTVQVLDTQVTVNDLKVNQKVTITITTQLEPVQE